MDNEKWTSVLKINPVKDGVYYAYTVNFMTGLGEITELKYKENKWINKLDKDVHIIAWREKPKEIIRNKEQWLKNHIPDIQRAFFVDKVECNCFEVVDNFIECLCDYNGFIYMDNVRYIDDAYVIKILY